MMLGRRVYLLGFFLLSAACTDTTQQAGDQAQAESEAVRSWLDSFDADASPRSPSNAPRQAPPVADMIDGLVAKLEQHPDDRKGWELLARSYEFLGDHEQARAAAERANALSAVRPNAGAATAN